MVLLGSSVVVELGNASLEDEVLISSALVDVTVGSNTSVELSVVVVVVGVTNVVSVTPPLPEQVKPF